ncbi:hypothetical protein ACLOJK_010815 [Asimina triloba]
MVEGLHGTHASLLTLPAPNPPCMGMTNQQLYRWLARQAEGRHGTKTALINSGDTCEAYSNSMKLQI